MAEQKVDRYPFHDEFERKVVSMAATRPRFYGAVGHAIQPEALTSEPARLAMQAIRAIARDLGRGPDDESAVLQRIRRWIHEGKATREQLLEVVDYLVSPAALPTDETVLTELLPILKRRLQHEAILAAHEGFSHKKDLDQAERLFARAKSLGASDVSLGVDLGDSGFDLLAKQRHLVRLPTGIDDLDSELEGGVPVGQLCMFMANSGGGKSMSLSHVTAHAITRHNLFVGYVTLELPPAHVMARILANITGVPIAGILAGGEEEKRARDLLSARPLGPCLIKDFTPQVTTVDEIKDWVKRSEDKVGRKMEALVVDYADKLAPPPAKRDKESGGYKAMEYVYEGLRVFVLEKEMWGFTASQTQGRKDERKAKRVDLEHASDSMNKIRVSDIVITLNYDDEAEEMKFFVAKNRTGRARREVGPLPVDFACGAVAPVIREAPPF